MTAIDNAGGIPGTQDLKNIFGGQTAVGGFVAGATYTYDGTDVVVTAAVTLASGDTFKRIHVQLFDKFGKEVRAEITTVTGTATLSAATLDKSRPLDLKVTITTVKNRVADGGAYNLRAAGSVGNWDIQKLPEA
jgi:hypothetical protein